MKGIVFNVFEEFLEEVAAPIRFDALCSQVELRTYGPFIGPGTYPDEDLFVLVDRASSALGVTRSVALRQFGEYLFSYFAKSYPNYTIGHNLFSFLSAVDKIIHVEVRKLYPDAITPKISCSQESSGRIILNYESPRRLWHLAEGLIQGAADHYKEIVSIDLRPSDGDESRCEISITPN